MQRRVLIAAVALAGLLLLPAGASAATRYASPTGSGTACTEADPCAVTPAIENAAPGDTVQLAAGNYLLSGQQIRVLANDVTIQGPAGVADPSSQDAFLLFGTRDLTTPTPSRLVVFADGTTIRNLGIDGEVADGAALVQGGTSARLRLDRVLLIATNEPSFTGGFGGIAFKGTNATVTNSILRHTGNSYRAYAVEMTGTLTGSLAYAPDGVAIGVSNGSHPNPDCSLTIRNTLAWGGVRNLLADTRSSAGGLSICPAVTVDYGYSWIPNPGTPTPSLGGGIEELEDFAQPATVTASAGNLPDAAAVFNPLAPGSTYIGTYELPASSPAVDAGCSTGCSPTDHDYYGRPRPIGSAVDIGPVEMFLPPTAPAPTVGSVRSTRARVSGTVNPNGLATTYAIEVRFEGSATWTKVAESTVAAGSAPVDVGATASDLEASTAFEARITATNAKGAVESAATRFSTPVAPKVELGRLRAAVGTKALTVTSRVTVTGAGVIVQRVSSKGRSKPWCTAWKEVASAGTYALSCQLGRKGRAALAKRTLRLTAKTTFTGTGESAVETQGDLRVRRR